MATSEKMLAYIHSPKGIATRKRYLEAHKEEVSEYRKKYMKERRIRLKKNGLCLRCSKNKPKEGRLQCEECLKYLGKKPKQKSNG